MPTTETTIACCADPDCDHGACAHEGCGHEASTRGPGGVSTCVDYLAVLEAPAPTAPSGFSVGQRVTILNWAGEVFRLTRVTESTAGGRVRVADLTGVTFDQDGLYISGRIVPTTAEHEAVVRRADLWQAIDGALGANLAGAERLARRSLVSPETLKKIAELLGACVS